MRSGIVSGRGLPERDDLDKRAQVCKQVYGRMVSRGGLLATMVSLLMYEGRIRGHGFSQLSKGGLETHNFFVRLGQGKSRGHFFIL